MGSGQGSSQSSDSIEGRLALIQGDVLKAREQLFQEWYKPKMDEVYNSFDLNSESSKAAFGQTAKEINNSFDTAQKQAQQTLAQRNMLNTGAGMALTATNQRARASALADAYANQMASSQDKKANFLSNMATLMPSTTTAAPTLSSSEGKSWGFSVG
jgi:hypothetical protein